MTIDKNELKKYALSCGVELNETAINRFDIYAERLIEYNKKVNLTAIKNPEDILIKHFVDSLYFLKYYQPNKYVSLCDVGTGAGFPGVALKIARPDIKITLFDSVNKKLDFLRELLPELKLDAEIVTIRAEEAGKNKEYREKFDIVTARAVAQLNILSEYCIPLVSVGGIFAPLKAILSNDEENKGIKALSELGCNIVSKNIYHLPDDSGREIIICKKISQTNLKYPRNAAQILKKPIDI